MTNPQNPYEDRNPYDAPSGQDAQNSYGQPTSASSASSYGQPSYDQPSYDQPSYDQPSYDQPSYDQPSNDQPAYGQSAQGQPSYGQAAQPSYQQPQPQPYGQPSAGGYAGYTAPQPYAPQYPVNPYAAVMAPEHPQGTAILVLGILGFVTSGITGLIAWIMGAKAEKEIAASGVTYSNASNIKIGKILGIVTTILGAIGLLFIIGYIVFVVILFASLATY